MRHPYDEAGTWVANLGPGYTGLGSGGTNTVQWSIRTTADAAVTGYDWADHTSVLELAGGEGQYLVLFPANVVGAAGRYVIRARSASGGKNVSEELIFAAPQYTGADTAGTTTLLSRLTSTRAGLLDHLDADISSRLATAGYTTPPTAAAIMAAVLDELASNHNTAGTVGKLIQNLDAAVSTRLAASGYTAPASLASIIAGIWDELQAGHTTAGSFGKYLDAAVSSRSTYAGADTAGTTTLLARLTTGRAANLDNLDTAVSGVAAAVWAVLTASLSTANTIGKRIVDNLDTNVGSRLATGSYTAPDNTAIAAVKAKTDGLPTDPADASDIAASFAALGSPAQTSDARFAHLDADVSSRSTLTAAQVWAASGRTLTSFGTLVADVAAAVWASVARTLTSGAAPSAADIWNELLAGHTTAGSAGKALSDAAAGGGGSSGSPWDELAADHDTAGTMGALLNAAGGWVNDIQNPIEIGKAALFTLNFGPGHAGLTTVGFQLYNENGAPFGPRHTAGVIDLGHGNYQAAYTWTEAWQGSIVGDTGGATPTYTDAASVVVSAPVAADIADIAAAVDSIEGRIGSGLVSAITPVLSGGRVEIVRGDDYYAADGRALVWTIPNSGWPNLAAATVSFVVDDILTVPAAVNTGAGTVTVELSTDATSLLKDAEQYTWALIAALADVHRATLATGVVTVRERIEASA